MTTYAPQTARDYTLPRMTPQQKSQCLFEIGYRCQLLSGGRLMVINPAGRQYVVSADLSECSCPASVRCCHRIGARSLALAQADADWDAAYSVGRCADEAKICDRGCWRYTAEGLRLRRASVALCDRYTRLREFAYEVAGGAL